MAFLAPLLSFNVINDWNITTWDYSLNRDPYFKYIKEQNIIKRSWYKNFDNIFKKELLKDRIYKLYNDYWEDIVNEKIKNELTVINKKWFSEYFENFLIITKYLRENKYLYFIRGSWAWSLVLFLLWISHINPIKYWLSFERFLGWNKTADIDIDIPWNDRKKIIQELNVIFNKKNKEVFLIANKSSENYDKITVSPAWVLIEDKSVSNDIPFFNVPQHAQKVSELFESGTTPVLDKLWYLKYDLLSSQVSWPIQEIFKSKKLNIMDYILNWEEKLNWKQSFSENLKEWTYFHFTSSKNLIKILNWYKPTCFLDLVKLLAVNRPAMYYALKIPDIIKNLNAWKITVTSDTFLNDVISSSESWDLILFQDQVISLLNYILPEIWLNKIIKLVKAKVKDKELIEIAINNWKLYEKSFISTFYEKTKYRKLAKQIWLQIYNFNHY